MPKSEDKLAKAYSIIICEFEALERAYKKYEQIRINNGHLGYLGTRYDIQCVFNDLLVLFLVRTRNIAGFFCSKGRTSDDIKLADFGFKDNDLIFFKNQEMYNLYRQISKHVTHFTYKQILDMSQREWDLKEIFNLMNKYFSVFKALMKLKNFNIVARAIEIERQFMRQN